MPPRKPLTRAQITNLLKFKIGWIKDPVPDFRRFLDRATLSKLARAKATFGKQVNTIVKSRKG